MDATNQAQDDDDPPPFPRQEQTEGGESSRGSSTSPVDNNPATAEAAAVKKEKGRVRFNSRAQDNPPPRSKSPVTPPAQSAELGDPFVPLPKPKPILREPLDRHDAIAMEAAAAAQERARQVAAQERARQLAAKVNRREEYSPASRVSVDSDAVTNTSEGDLIPLRDMSARNGAHSALPTEDEEERDKKNKASSQHEYLTLEAPSSSTAPPHREAPSEINDGNYDGLYSVAAPGEYRGNVLSQLLRLYKQPGELSGSTSTLVSSSAPGPRHVKTGSQTSLVGDTTAPGTPGSGTGTTTPNRRKWYEQNRSQDTLINLVEASARLANPNDGSPKGASTPANKKRPPMHKRTGSGSRLSTLLQNNEEQLRITVHIAETLARQDYIIKLCRALMLFGAPTHRLEEYLSTTANILEIDGQFLYLPGCMIISFDDRSTHTTEVRIVRTAQGIDLGRLKDTHHVYKEVIHDVIGAEEGTAKLEELIGRRDKFHAWLRVLIFGLTSASAAPFSFSARLIDLPLTFCFGCLVGFLQLIVAPMSMLYSNVLEVSATVLISFLARAFGSIRGGDLFCFSAMAQGGIVMLLPGYMVLCSALELQSRAIVPGSIRIVYAIIYSLFLGFGITVGAALYGLFDANATSATTCQNPIPAYWTFVAVPIFVVCIAILYQAKWRQMPVMVVVAFAGYMVNFFSGLRFAAAPQIANTLGALTVGVLANLYSRIRHGVAAATLIPAIFTQVPGGLASTGGLLSGLSTANMLTNSTQEVNGTGSVQFEHGESLNTVVFNVAASMIQIAIGIAVGLFISALVIYPLGKRRSGLFSF
ncbi:pheromone-regulated membrane protein [Plectosphaerella plurivora]|uniref:Pheromone-regulated membrane protein n=1 Tax=Plectosphaerella plurivora TaxID=936078 RepID=A0A9P9AFU0_9PEZI|nr:pheromone-regulated membrane protein [Plectosphaerella plurivora]